MALLAMVGLMALLVALVTQEAQIALVSLVPMVALTALVDLVSQKVKDSQISHDKHKIRIVMSGLFSLFCSVSVRGGFVVEEADGRPCPQLSAVIF